MRRRDFVRAACGASVAVGMPSLVTAASRRSADCGIGLELISVLTPLGVNLRQTLRRVAAIGYREVETLGSLGRSPQEIAAILRECHLRSPAQHLVPDELYGVYQRWGRGELSLAQALVQLRDGYALERLDHIIDQGIERATVIGQHFLVWPVLFDAQVASSEALRVATDAFNSAGERCRRAGLTFAFHNGSNASRRIGQTLVYDLILKQTNPATVKMELDTYYLSQSGASAPQYLLTHPKRYPLLHLKDVDAHGQIADLGQGTLDLLALVSAARRVGVEHCFVEHDRAAQPFDSARASFDYLRRL
jgi:sugar phosphate isomerase/epimerase